MNKFLPIILIFLFSCTKNNTFVITDYGAKGDSTTLNTQAIQHTINLCYKNNGGIVVIPEGVFYSGSLELKNNVTLHLQEGAKLLASEDIKDYTFYGVDYHSYDRNYGGHANFPADKRFAFIFAHKAKNIGITGKGIIDGNGGNGEAFQVTVDANGKWNKPRRPNLINFVSCDSIIILDVKLHYCQNWNLHLENSENIVVNGIDILGHANANDDGIDINSCRNVTIKNCKVDVGDDALVFKTKGKNNNENIMVDSCTFASETRCIQFGSETEGDMKNITITNCTLQPTKERIEWPQEGAKPWTKLVQRRLGAGLSINTNDGGTISDVTISNIQCIGLPSPIYLHTAQRQWLYSEGRFDSTMNPGILKNITISDFEAIDAIATANSTIMGMNGFPLENITLKNITITYSGQYDVSKTQLEYLEDMTTHCAWPGYWGKENYYPAKGFEFRYVNGLYVDNVSIKSQYDSRPDMIISHGENVNINHEKNEIVSK